MADSSTVGQRIAQLIQQLGISKNAFAVSLDKTATVIQHLVDERNKPGFDLLCKIFDVYPNVSKDWLLQGTGTMLNTPAAAEDANKGQAASASKAALNATTLVEQESAEKELPAPVPLAKPVSATEPTPPTPVVTVSASEPVTAAAIPSVAETTTPAASPAAAPLPAPAPVSDTGAWQTALYTQQMAHQLALAELRNQHLQEQQRLMQQMMELMQRQLSS